MFDHLPLLFAKLQMVERSGQQFVVHSSVREGGRKCLTLSCILNVPLAIRIPTAIQVVQ